MRIFSLILFSLFISCSHTKKYSQPREGVQQYSYYDVSGKFVLIREHKTEKNKLITRTLLSDNESGTSKVLEKSITVTELGTVQSQAGRLQVSRPLASDFTVWLEGKKYQSTMRLSEKEKKLIVELNSPEEKWNGLSKYSFPKGKFFCFFSQIPDCLHHNSLLKKALEGKQKGISFHIVWDNYPYIQDQLNGVGLKPFSYAVLKFEDFDKKNLKYIVEVDGQSVLYHFSPSFDLIRMLWISQGITVVPPGEEINSEEQ